MMAKRRQSTNNKPTSDTPAPALTSYDRLIADHMGKRVSVNGKDGPRELTMEQVVIEKRTQGAVEGNSHSQRQTLEDFRRVEEKRQKRLEHEIKTWRDIKIELERQYAEHRHTHGRDPDILPHPDDIHICYRTGVRIDGPLVATERDAMINTLQVIDALYKQEALDQRSAPTGPSAAHQKSATLVFALMLEGTLPQRLQRSDVIQAKTLRRYLAKPKRELLKDVRQSWKRLGIETRRGQGFASMAKALPPLEALLVALPAAVQEADQHRLTDQRFGQRLEELFLQEMV